MIRPLYDWTLRLAETRYAMWALAAVAFIESSVFPIPPDVLMIPMILARPRRAWEIAALATLASVLGGLAGYWIGASLFESVGRPVLEFYGKEEYFGAFRDRYNDYGAWAVLIAGVTPFPYKVITILSGTTGLSLAVFAVASVVARGLRFFVLAALLWKFGPPIRDFIERRLGLLFTLFVAVAGGRFRGSEVPVSRRSLMVIAGLGSLLLLLGAWGFQAAGYAPCKLCLWQRWPHAVAVLLAVVGFVLPLAAVAAAGALAALTTAGIGVYHAGVEYGWWPGPASCTGDGGGLIGMSGADLLSTEGTVDIVMCDEVVWQFLGISMAGWNAILSLSLVAIWVLALRVSAR